LFVVSAGETVMASGVAAGKQGKPGMFPGTPSAGKRNRFTRS
jgi:hypothetical protein